MNWENTVVFLFILYPTIGEKSTKNIANKTRWIYAKYTNRAVVSIYRIIPQIFLSPDKTSIDQFIGIISFNASSEETIFNFLPDNLEKSNRLFFFSTIYIFVPSIKINYTQFPFYQSLSCLTQ